MKKKLFTVLVALMILVTACGDNKNDSIEPEIDNTDDIQSEPIDELETEEVDEDEPEEVADEAEPDTVEDEADIEATVDSGAVTDDEQDREASDSEEYETLEEFYIANQSALDAQWLPIADSYEGMSAAVEVNDNNLIVTVKFLDSSSMVEGIAEALTEALDERADAFKSQAGQFDEELGFEKGTCALTMRYTDPDDNVLAERTCRND